MFQNPQHPDRENIKVKPIHKQYLWYIQSSLSLLTEGIRAAHLFAETHCAFPYIVGWQSCACIGPQKLFVLRGFAFRLADHILNVNRLQYIQVLHIFPSNKQKLPQHLSFHVCLIPSCPPTASGDNALLLLFIAAFSFIIHTRKIQKEMVLRSGE